MKTSLAEQGSVKQSRLVGRLGSRADESVSVDLDSADTELGQLAVPCLCLSLGEGEGAAVGGQVAGGGALGEYTSGLTLINKTKH